MVKKTIQILKDAEAFSKDIPDTLFVYVDFFIEKDHSRVVAVLINKNTEELDILSRKFHSVDQNEIVIKAVDMGRGVRDERWDLPSSFVYTKSKVTAEKFKNYNIRWTEHYK